MKPNEGLTTNEMIKLARGFNVSLTQPKLYYIEQYFPELAPEKVIMRGKAWNFYPIENAVEIIMKEPKNTATRDEIRAAVVNIILKRRPLDVTFTSVHA